MVPAGPPSPGQMLGKPVKTAAAKRREKRERQAKRDLAAQLLAVRAQGEMAAINSLQWHAQHGTAPAPGYGGNPYAPPPHGPPHGPMNNGPMPMNGQMPMYGGNGGWVPQGAEYY